MGNGNKRQVKRILREQGRELVPLEAVLTDLGIKFPDFWDDPLDVVEKACILRMTELLLKEDVADTTRINAMLAAYKIHPLGALASLKSSERTRSQFQQRFSKKEPEEPKAIEVEKVEPVEAVESVQNVQGVHKGHQDG